MRLNELKDNKGALKTGKRVGRGIGSGLGKTAGRGQKGQKARSGVSLAGFEGGQMPLYRRLPKRGFKSMNRVEYEIVNLGQIAQAVVAGKLDAKNLITLEALQTAGLIHRLDSVKILSKGELTAGFSVQAHKASQAAVKLLEEKGGKVALVEKK